MAHYRVTKKRLAMLRRLHRIQKELREVQQFCKEQEVGEAAITNAIVWVHMLIDRIDEV